MTDGIHMEAARRDKKLLLALMPLSRMGYDMRIAALERLGAAMVAADYCFSAGIEAHIDKFPWAVATARAKPSNVFDLISGSVFMKTLELMIEQKWGSDMPHDDMPRDSDDYDAQDLDEGIADDDADDFWGLGL